ncbi:hypothetical protein GZ77_06290 [Endozoicomonas montiporae]|uniref:Flagellar protein FliT n=2 Tax=Endozoicomonas montiporae TaxID=1027273 RepID=A0A081NC96_9GAMM|nr:hypothetical protein [Endozoicomonas montiporae]AMO56402.1 hypothetical protein EZMO1_2302 [Endozoicomonas montiporae CL-33]KEQ16069.1 hypothetical protein GZ77_06290 [Endozoicomonas montiporae]
MAASNPAVVREELAVLQQELIEASEQKDWPLVQDIDDDIRELLKAVHPDWKQGELADVIVDMKQTYERIFVQCRQRRVELKEKMEAMRSNKDALEGYKNSQAAGNRELRKQA